MSAKYVDVVVANDEMAPVAEKGAMAKVTNQGSGSGGDGCGEGGASGGGGGGGDGGDRGGGGGDGGEGGGGDGGGGVGWVRSVASFSLSQGVGLLTWVGDNIGAPVDETAGGTGEKAAAEAAAAAAAAEAAAAEAAAAAVAAAAEAAAAAAEAEAEEARRAEAAKFFWQRAAPCMSWFALMVRLALTFVAGIALGGMGYEDVSSTAGNGGGVADGHQSPAHQSPSMWESSSPTSIGELQQHRANTFSEGYEEAMAEYEDDVDLSMSACGLRFIGNIFTGAARYASVSSEPADDFLDDETAMAEMEMGQDEDDDVDLSISGCGLRFVGNIFRGAAKFAGVYPTPETSCRRGGDGNCIDITNDGGSRPTGNVRWSSEATMSWTEWGDALLDGPWV